MAKRAKTKARHMKAKPREKLVTICPKCGSTDVQHDWSNPATVSAGLSNVIYKCNHCGHTGLVFPQGPESEAPKTPKDPSKIKEKELVNTTYGQGEVGMLKVMGPLAIIASIIIILFDTFNTLRIYSLLISLPVGVFATSVGFGKERIAKSEFLKTFCIMMIIYEIVVGTILFVRLM